MSGEGVANFKLHHWKMGVHVNCEDAVHGIRQGCSPFDGMRHHERDASGGVRQRVASGLPDSCDELELPARTAAEVTPDLPWVIGIKQVD